MEDTDRIKNIQQRLIELEKEKQNLITELKELKIHQNKNQFEINEVDKLQTVNFYGKIIRNKIPQSKTEKIKLFYDLFACRTDVYPKMWTNTKGYLPACSNEWKEGICHKRIIKCSECTNKNYTKLDLDIIESHLT